MEGNASVFAKKPEPQPEPITGSEALRKHLKVRISRGAPLGSVARDLNDNIAAEVNRRSAREMAMRMAGDGADEITISNIEDHGEQSSNQSAGD